jgi:hypothetical protein
MDRIEINVTTGERKVIALTQEEVADVNVRTQEELDKPAVTQETILTCGRC